MNQYTGKEKIAFYKKRKITPTACTGFISKYSNSIIIYAGYRSFTQQGVRQTFAW